MLIEDLTISQIFKKTFVFILLRLFIIFATILPTISLTFYFKDLFFRVTGLHVKGIVYNVFSISFIMVGFYVSYILFHYLRKTILFYIKAAHVIAITKLCTDDVGEGNLVIDSFTEIRKRFVTINVFFLADSLAFKCIKEIGHLIMEQDIIPIFKTESKNSLYEKCKGFFFYLIGSTVGTTLNYCDEIVLSYAYVQCRVRELFPEEDNKESTKKTSKKKKEKIMFTYIIDGICFYVKSCIPLLQKSFMSVLYIDVAGIVCSVIISIIVLFITGGNLYSLVISYIAFRIIYSFIKYIFLEPYETVTLIHTFYENLYETTDPIDLVSIRDNLSSQSESFANLVSSALGKDSVNKNSSNNTSIIDGDIIGATTIALSESLGIDILPNIPTNNSEDKEDKKDTPPDSTENINSDPDN